MKHLCSTTESTPSEVVQDRRLDARTGFNGRRRAAIACSVIAVVGLAACGGGDGAISDATVEGTEQVSPFAEVTACLQEQGLDVEEPSMAARGGGLPDGATPPGGSLPEGGMPPGGSLPGGTMPEGGFQPGGTLPGGTMPEGGFPGGTLPGGSVPADLAAGATDRMAEMFGVDATDPVVAAALEVCSDEMEAFGPGGRGAPPANGDDGAPGTTATSGG